MNTNVFIDLKSLLLHIIIIKPVDKYKEWATYNGEFAISIISSLASYDM